MQEVTNIILEFDEIAAAEYRTKISLLVAAGGADLPDVLMTRVGLKEATAWGLAEAIIPLNHYYDTISYYVDKSFEEGCEATKEQALTFMTSYDGNIYGLPYYSESPNNDVSGSRAVINQPWLDKLGIDRHSIVTTEDFRDVLTAFKENDMNDNGDVNDEIPMLTSTNYHNNLRKFLMAPFVFMNANNNYTVNENGKIDMVFDRDEFREGLKYAHSLIEQGLLMPETFTQDQAQVTAIMSGEKQVVGVLARISASNLGSHPSYYDYRYLLPLEGPTGVREIGRVYSSPIPAWLITANCKTPEAAFRLGDYLCSEEMTIWDRYGIEGEHWRKPEANETTAYQELGLLNAEAVLAVKSGSSITTNYMWYQAGPSIKGTKIFYGELESEDETARKQSLDNARDLFATYDFVNTDKTVAALVYNEEENEIITSRYDAILTYVNECWARFALGDLDINNDADWQNYLNDLNAMGVDECLKAIQSCYDRMYK